MARTIRADQFEALYSATAKDVFAYVRRRLAHDAEEIVAETYAIAWRRRSDMPAPPFRRAWLFGVARTLLLAEQRRHQRERNTLHDAAHALAERPYGSESADDSNAGAAGLISSSTSDAVESKANAALAAAMKRLTPMQREVLTLTAWECLTPGELAVVLVIKPGAARVRLHRARQALAADPQVRALAAQRQPVGDALQINTQVERTSCRGVGNQ